MKLDARFRLFLFITGFFVTALLVGNLIGGKLFQFRVFGTTFTMSVGLIPFPIVFLLTDILNEFYGKRAARLVTLVGFVMALFTISIIWVSARIPWAPFELDPATWAGFTPDAFQRIYVGSIWMLIASEIAYLTSQLIDIAVFHALKRMTRNKYLWLRATGSTIVSQGIDTLFITFLAFKGKLPVSTLFKMVATAYVVKFVVAVALTPVIYAGHACLERVFKMEPLRVREDPGQRDEPAL